KIESRHRMASFADDNQQELRAVAIFLVKLLQLANLATKVVSGKTREDDNERLFLPQVGEVHQALLTNPHQPKIGRLRTYVERLTRRHSNTRPGIELRIQAGNIGGRRRRCTTGRHIRRYAPL